MKLKDEDKANEKYFVSVVHYMKAIKLMEVWIFFKKNNFFSNNDFFFFQK